MVPWLNLLCNSYNPNKGWVLDISVLVVGRQHKELIRQPGPGVVLITQNCLQLPRARPNSLINQEEEKIAQDHITQHGPVHFFNPQHFVCWSNHFITGKKDTSCQCWVWASHNPGQVSSHSTGRQAVQQEADSIYSSVDWQPVSKPVPMVLWGRWEEVVVICQD